MFATDITAGAALFESMNGQYSCSVCHVPSITTGNRCQPINGGEFRIPEALARKTIHPFGDFLLHDIGTGDFIVQNGGPITRTQFALRHSGACAHAQTSCTTVRR